MEAKVYDEVFAKRVEQAVMEAFGCQLSELVGLKDTEGKEALVFVLFKFYDFDKKQLGKAYWITWPYVPTVADKMTERFLGDKNYREKVKMVLAQVGYSNNLKVA